MEVLLITGPAGVGKTTVAHELSRQLERGDVPHALIDTDELDRIYPVPPDLKRVTEECLAAVWGVLHRHGATRVVLVGVYLDRAQEREWIARALPDAEFACVRLVASLSSLRERVLRREIGSGAVGQMERTLDQLAALNAEGESSLHVISTDARSPEEVAAEIASIWAPSN